MSTDTTRYEVQQYTFCEGWINTWAITDSTGAEQPEIFATEAEAQAELSEFFDEIKSQIATGERESDNGYDVEDFRIVPVGQTS